MKSGPFIVKILGICAAIAALWFAVGFAFTPAIDVEQHKEIGDRLWSTIEQSAKASGRYPQSEEELLNSDIFSRAERQLFLDRSFGHRKFGYLIDDRWGPSLLLEHQPGTLSKASVWRRRTNTGSSAATGVPPGAATQESSVNTKSKFTPTTDGD